MKRVIISISILTAMVSLGIFFNIRISVRCNELIELTELIQENIENKSEALEYAGQFDSEWESFHHESIFIIRGDRLSEIENCYIRIIPLIETDNDELSAELAELKSILIHTKASEIPNIYNIF